MAVCKGIRWWTVRGLHGGGGVVVTFTGKSAARLASVMRISQSRCSQLRVDSRVLRVREVGRGVVSAVCEETTLRTFSRSALGRV